jgi:4-hydroxybenzoate polyprenyltransferase
MPVLIEILRPFTLLPPLVGMLTGAVSALGLGRPMRDPASIALSVGAGALMAALLNGASNVLNQIHDFAIDRVNHPGRPLPSGRISLPAARGLAIALYAGSILLAAAIRPHGEPEILGIVVLTAGLTWAYSAPPLRLRRFPFLAPLVIALPRGGLLKVAGWATVAPVFADREPWLLGLVFFLFVLGGASIKDFADEAGDRAHGVVSLPIRLGRLGAARLMAPFYVLPWILLAAFAAPIWGGRSLLSAPCGPMIAAALLVAGLGFLAARRLLRGAATGAGAWDGRAAWRDLYRLMILGQVLVGGVYLL